MVYSLLLREQKSDMSECIETGSHDEQNTILHQQYEVEDIEIAGKPCITVINYCFSSNNQIDNLVCRQQTEKLEEVFGEVSWTHPFER